MAELPSVSSFTAIKQPVAKMVYRCSISRLYCGFFPACSSPHAFILAYWFCSSSLVAIGQVHIPGDNGGYVCPAGTTARPGCGRIMADAHSGITCGTLPCRVLVGSNILEPLGEKIMHVHIKGCRTRKYLRVARPA